MKPNFFLFGLCLLLMIAPASAEMAISGTVFDMGAANTRYHVNDTIIVKSIGMQLGDNTLYTDKGNFTRVALGNLTLFMGNISITNNATGSDVLSYELNYSIGNTKITTTNATNVLFTNETYTYAINKSNSFIDPTEQFFTPSTVSYEIQLYSNSAVTFNFLDEETRETVFNVTYEIFGENFATEASTTVGQFNITGLSDDSYEVRYSSDGYEERSYFFDIPLTGINQSNDNLYLINTSISSDFVLTVTDKNNQPVAGLTATLLRRYVVDNQTQYIPVEMMKPAVALQGSTPFHAVANTQAYLFRVEDANGDVLFQGSGATPDNTETLFLIDSNMFIKVNTEASPFKSAEQINGLSYSLTNTSNSFWLSYNSESSVINGMCLKVYTNNTDLLSESCSDQASGVIGISYSILNGTYYVGQAIVNQTIDNNEFLLDLHVVDFRDKNASVTFGILGLFILLLTLIFEATALASRPAFMMLAGALTIMAFGVGVLGFAVIGLVAQSTILVLAIILMFTIKD